MTTATRTRTRSCATTNLPNGELRVSGRGWRKADFALCWSVPSQTEANRYHVVTQIAEGHFICDCRAAQFGRADCAHRKTVRETLAREEAAFQARIAAQQAPRQTTDEERESAILHRDSRPFSIWK